MANEMLEFVKAYEYCFFRVKLKISKENRAFVLRGLNNADQHVAGGIVTSRFKERSVRYPYMEFREDAEPIVPIGGYINTPLDGRETALYLHVSPDRQYRKALFYDGHSVAPPPTESKVFAAFMQKVLNEDFEGFYVKAYASELAINFKPRFYSVRQALEVVENGQAHSVAISRFFALSLHKNYSVPVLWHKNRMEGIVKGQTIYVTNKVLPFKDFFRKKFDFNVESINEVQVLSK